MKLPRLCPRQAFILNQYVLCRNKADGFEELYKDSESLNDKFIKEYWNLKEIDVYLATSMRSLEDCERAERICNELEDIIINDRNLLIYNPANNCEASRLRKYDLEKHMIGITKTLIIDAGSQDTGGKFIEAMYAKSLRKPIIMLADNEHMYKIYHNYHPQSLTLGMHVCKNLEVLKECGERELKGNVKVKTEKIDNKSNKICSNCESIITRI